MADIVENLTKLKALADAGILSEEEFELRKTAMLDAMLSPGGAPESAPATPKELQVLPAATAPAPQRANDQQSANVVLMAKVARAEAREAKAKAGAAKAEARATKAVAQANAESKGFFDMLGCGMLWGGILGVLIAIFGG